MVRYIEIADQNALGEFLDSFDSFHDWIISEVRAIDHTCYGAEEKLTGKIGDVLQFRMHQIMGKSDPIELLMIGVLKRASMETGQITNATGSFVEDSVFSWLIKIQIDSSEFLCRRLLYMVQPNWNIVGGALGPQLPEGI